MLNTLVIPLISSFCKYRSSVRTHMGMKKLSEQNSRAHGELQWKWWYTRNLVSLSFFVTQLPPLPFPFLLLNMDFVSEYFSCSTAYCIWLLTSALLQCTPFWLYTLPPHFVIIFVSFYVISLSVYLQYSIQWFN
jgi:hypothetical protein